MRFASLQKAAVLKRLNRFVVQAKDSTGRIISLHLANSGRLKELIVPGREIWFQPFQDQGDKRTCGRLLLIRNDVGTLVCIDATLPNAIVEEALRQGKIPGFANYPSLRREYTIGKSRFDFYLRSDDAECFIEVKSVTLVEAGVAMFPDAPTERGLKHLDELGRLQSERVATAVIFLIQREDATAFTPNDRTQPEFREHLRAVWERGVQVLAYDCRLTESEIELRQPVKLMI